MFALLVEISQQPVGRIDPSILAKSIRGNSAERLLVLFNVLFLDRILCKPVLGKLVPVYLVESVETTPSVANSRQAAYTAVLSTPVPLVYSTAVGPRDCFGRT